MTDQHQENKINSTQGNVGVYICYCGGNISDHVDVEKVREDVAKLPEVAVARTNMFMCSDPGQEMIMEDLKNGIVDRVVVASCAPSLHESTFRGAISRAGANPFIYDHANIREQVSWVHHGDSATDKATRLVAMSAAKAKQLKPLNPIRVDALKHATVIGGGMAGLRSALDLADRGIQVSLIERSPFLGGQLARLDRIAPTGDKAADLIEALALRVLNHDAIKVHACSEIKAFEGYVGNFKLKIHQHTEPLTGADVGKFTPNLGVYAMQAPSDSQPVTLETGVIVLATGFQTYVPYKGEYGFGDHEAVITLSDLIQHVAATTPTGGRLTINGKKIRSMAMIHCVGSRQIPGIHPENEAGYLNEYCSRTCCSATLNTANMVRESFPETHVYEFYRDIRTYGRDQEALYERASANKVVFIRFEAEASPEVLPMPRGIGFDDFPLMVRAADTLTFGETVEAPVDLVVLATGMEPNPVSKLVEMMKLPVGADRFLLEVHPKLRPVELPVSGILLAGTCQAPMDVGEACNAAGAAAVKAAALLGKGYVELDPFVAKVDIQKCQGTGACLEACLNPGALTLVAMEIEGQTVRRAQVTPALCMGCGACVAVCPENAIDIDGWTLKQYEAMVDRIVADMPAHDASAAGE